MSSLFKTTLSYEPPWRLRSTEDENGEWGREQPLQGNRDSSQSLSAKAVLNFGKDVPIGVLVQHAVVVVGNATNDDTTDRPEHLQHLGSWGSQPQRHDLGAVGRCICNEDTPWHTLKNLGREHDWERFGKVEDEDEGVQSHQACQGCITVTDATGKRSSKKDTDKCAQLFLTS